MRQAAIQTNTPISKEETPMKAGSTIQSIAQRVDRLARSSRDFLANPHQIRLTTGSGEEAKSASLVLNDGSGALSFGVTDIVHDQLADFAGIPMAYYQRMRNDAPDLLTANINGWFSRGTGRRLVRTALDDHDKPAVRAFLSDRYRPLDHQQLLEAVLPLVTGQGMRIESCELTEKRLYVKALSQRVTAEVQVGDTVMAGIVISNSEVGFGALSIQPLIFTLACTNGMIVSDHSLRQHHVGRRQGVPDNGDILHLLSDETRAADDRAFFLRVRDVAKAALDEGLFHQQVQRLRAAAGQPITSDRPDRVVEVTARRFGLSESEGAGILMHLLQGGELNQWGLCSAITRHSQDLKDYDRATELERIGGRLIELPRSEWQMLSSATSVN